MHCFVLHSLKCFKTLCFTQILSSKMEINHINQWIGLFFWHDIINVYFSNLNEYLTIFFKKKPIVDFNIFYSMCQIKHRTACTVYSLNSLVFLTTHLVSFHLKLKLFYIHWTILNIKYYHLWMSVLIFFVIVFPLLNYCMFLLV